METESLVKSSYKLKPYYLHSNFYREAEAMREQFEKEISHSVCAGSGMTPLFYVFLKNKFQLLTASAERVFGPEILAGFIEEVRVWANNVLGISHVSTPQLRVYVNGCWRDVGRDDVNAQWHYLLSLARNSHSRNASWLKILVDNSQTGARQLLPIHRISRPMLRFNELIVHPANTPYGIESQKTSMNPLDSLVFLDGYLW